MSLSQIALTYGIDPGSFAKQYKNHLSDYGNWKQKEHAQDYILFPENMGKRLSIDETSVSNGELYTIITNKAGRGGKGSLVALIKGTKASVVSDVLECIPVADRMNVKEITLDMDSSMDWITRTCFMNAQKIVDRFHVQKLVSEALQEMRIKLRWKALDEANQNPKKAKQTYANGDTKKQLLARSRHLLFKPQGKWTESQQERATILFQEFPDLKQGYQLSMQFRSFYEHSKNQAEGKERLEQWYTAIDQKITETTSNAKKKGEERDNVTEKEKRKKTKREKQAPSPFLTFRTAAQSIKQHQGRILNYFDHRSTNAAAESFNAKIKGFRALTRGVIDKSFFLYRLAMIYG